MSSLSRVNSQNKKPKYKDYVLFLDSYRNSRKDDQDSVITSDSGVNFSLNSSPNYSSSSVFSDSSDVCIKHGYKEHIENRNNEKLHSVLPSKMKQQKQTVKTEMYIQINSPPSTPSYPTHVFAVQNDNKSEPVISVSNATRIFERIDQHDSKSINTEINSAKKNTVEEISKKFEVSPTPSKPVVKRAASIGEVSKIFENNSFVRQSNIHHKTMNFNAIPKPFQPTTTPQLNSNDKVSSKPAIVYPKPATTASVSSKSFAEPSSTYADSIDSALSSLSISPSPPQCLSPPPETFSSCPPPPPPMPTTNIISKSILAPKPTYVNTPKISNGLSNQQVHVQTNGNTTSNGTLDRNDPRVRRAVYGALRNMYGSYHDQANDYVATLPKNRVKKNNGLDSIIDSIASQGGLGKLNGRVNPNPEVD